MKYRTFHPHLHNNNRTRPGLPLHAWVASAETAEPDEDGDGAESRDTLLASWIREQGCRKQMSSLTESIEQGIDRPAAEWISGQMPHEREIARSGSFSPSTL